MILEMDTDVRSWMRTCRNTVFLKEGDRSQISNSNKIWILGFLTIGSEVPVSAVKFGSTINLSSYNNFAIDASVHYGTIIERSYLGGRPYVLRFCS